MKIQKNTVQYNTMLRNNKHFCSVENGSHTLTDKRAAHDNGLHLQSDTHTIHIRKGNGLLEQYYH